MQISIETVTPDVAKTYLDLNKLNRNPSDPTIDLYARQMREGLWVLNSESLKFDSDGHLIDGQHRLHACLRANKPFETYVVRGLPREAQDTIDIGRKRTTGDQLTLAGIPYGSNAAAVIRVILAISSETTNVRITAQEAKQFIDKWPTVIKSTERACYGNFRKPMNQAAIGAVHFIASEFLGLPDMAQSFVTTLNTGKNMRNNDDPAFVFRERLMQRRMHNTRVNSLQELQELIHVWNLYRAGKRLRQLKLPAEVRIIGFEPEKFNLHTFFRVGVSPLEQGDGEQSESVQAKMWRDRTRRRRGALQEFLETHAPEAAETQPVEAQPEPPAPVAEEVKEQPKRRRSRSKPTESQEVLNV
jgi:hypothetical protein